MKYSVEIGKNKDNKELLVKKCKSICQNKIDKKTVKDGDVIVFWTDDLPPEVICTITIKDSKLNVDYD